MEEVSPMTRTQNKHDYVSPVMMKPAFGTIYYDLGVGQSSIFRTRYYNSEAASSYMHGHGRGCGKHNEYLNYEVPIAVPEQSDEQ
uniref:Uncharacterized protein n=1 Tax=Cucumis melo TaxID=3656 RepID=A0A9I9E7V4_CUCME